MPCRQENMERNVYGACPACVFSYFAPVREGLTRTHTLSRFIPSVFPFTGLRSGNMPSIGDSMSVGNVSAIRTAVMWARDLALYNSALVRRV